MTRLEVIFINTISFDPETGRGSYNIDLMNRGYRHVRLHSCKLGDDTVLFSFDGIAENTVTCNNKDMSCFAYIHKGKLCCNLTVPLNLSSNILKFYITSEMVKEIPDFYKDDELPIVIELID